MWPSFRKFQLAELGNDTCTPFEADDNITNSTLLRTHRKGCLRRRICTQSNCNNQQSFLIAQSWNSRLEYESANKPTSIWNPILIRIFKKTFESPLKFLKKVTVLEIVYQTLSCWWLFLIKSFYEFIEFQKRSLDYIHVDDGSRRQILLMALSYVTNRTLAEMVINLKKFHQIEKIVTDKSAISWCNQHHCSNHFCFNNFELLISTIL